MRRAPWAAILSAQLREAIGPPGGGPRPVIGLFHQRPEGDVGERQTSLGGPGVGRGGNYRAEVAKQWGLSGLAVFSVNGLRVENVVRSGNAESGPLAVAERREPKSTRRAPEALTFIPCLLRAVISPTDLTYASGLRMPWLSEQPLSVLIFNNQDFTVSLFL